MPVRYLRYDPRQSRDGSCATRLLHRCRCAQTMTTSCSVAMATSTVDHQKALMSAAVPVVIFYSYYCSHHLAAWLPRAIKFKRLKTKSYNTVCIPPQDTATDLPRHVCTVYIYGSMARRFGIRIIQIRDAPVTLENTRISAYLTRKWRKSTHWNSPRPGQQSLKNRWINLFSFHAAILENGEKRPIWICWSPRHSKSVGHLSHLNAWMQYGTQCIVTVQCSASTAPNAPSQWANGNMTYTPEPVFGLRWNEYPIRTISHWCHSTFFQPVAFVFTEHLMKNLVKNLFIKLNWHRLPARPIAGCLTNLGQKFSVDFQ